MSDLSKGVCCFTKGVPYVCSKGCKAVASKISLIHTYQIFHRVGFHSGSVADKITLFMTSCQCNGGMLGTFLAILNFLWARKSVGVHSFLPI